MTILSSSNNPARQLQIIGVSIIVEGVSACSCAQRPVSSTSLNTKQTEQEYIQVSPNGWTDCNIITLQYIIQHVAARQREGKRAQESIAPMHVSITLEDICKLTAGDGG